MRPLVRAARGTVLGLAGVIWVNCGLVIDPITQSPASATRPDAQSPLAAVDAARDLGTDVGGPPDAMPPDALPEAPACPTAPGVKVVACGVPLGSKLLAIGGGSVVWARVTNSQGFTELWQTRLGGNSATRLVPDPVGPHATDGRTLAWQGGASSSNTVFALDLAVLAATPRQQNFNSTGLRLSGGLGVGSQGILLAGEGPSGLRYGTLALDLVAPFQLLEARPQTPFEVPYMWGVDMFGWTLDSLGPGTFGRIPGMGPTQVSPVDGQMRSTPVRFGGRVYYLRRTSGNVGLVLTSVQQTGAAMPQSVEIASSFGEAVNTFVLAVGTRSLFAWPMDRSRPAKNTIWEISVSGATATEAFAVPSGWSPLAGLVVIGNTPVTAVDAQVGTPQALAIAPR